jgi:hypothetical protein
MDVLAHCRAMAAFCRQRVAFENENDAFWKRNLCYWSWHLSTSRRCLHGQSRQGPRKACSYRVEAGTADAPKLAFAA